MTDLSKMFDRDIALYGLMEKPRAEHDATTQAIHGALREALCWGMAHRGFGYFRDSPEGITELEGEYDLAFVARVIRAALP